VYCGLTATVTLLNTFPKYSSQTRKRIERCELHHLLLLFR